MAVKTLLGSSGGIEKMKKLLASMFALLFAFVLVGCNANKEPLSIIVPNGAPALSQIFLQEETDKYSVTIVNGEDPLVAALGSGSDDFVFCATNAGAKLYASGVDYKFVAAITFGNLFLVSDQENFTLSSLEGKEIVLFGQNATPDIILKYILQENNINATLTYVDSVASANAAYAADHSKIVMTAEPLMSVLALNAGSFNVIDLQQEYKNITGRDSYPQAGVFAKNTLSDRQINTFLDDLQASVEKVNGDVDATVALAAQLEYTFPEAVIRSAIPNSNIGFKTAEDVRSDLEYYFNIILDMNSDLIGGALPDNDFYYQ